ncbi:acetate/propionate family kinase [Nocardioides taihuensis]|uniref:Acetate kinase n=1 Tax=Nocardioides taihuensis TaxID=1835606 RepID=A0ABW0BLB1_9ACTN
MAGSGLVLVLNAGSSSLKYAVVDAASGASRLREKVERIDESGWDGAFAEVSDRLAQAGIDAGDLAGVGHRVVHGGPRFTTATVVDDAVLAEIRELARLAPLHNPPAAAGIEAARAAWPGLAQVAVFDTAFFADLPTAAATYAVDRAVAGREHLRRYGAHGTSHAWVAGQAARFLGRDLAEVDQVVLHLGNGASAAAIRGGRPVETSMGLTPLEGLVMGTRAGDLDPGLVLHLLRHGDYDGGPLDADALEDLLHHRSGLEGLAGRHDFRDLLGAVDAGDADARTAYDVTCHRIRKYVGAYLAVLDGADAITFTGGVGEHVPRLRADSLAGLDRLGVEVDATRNEQRTDGPRLISSEASRVAVLVVPTDEERAIAAQVAALV